MSVFGEHTRWGVNFIAAVTVLSVVVIATTIFTCWSFQ